MKNILILAVAVALLALGWFVWFDRQATETGPGEADPIADSGAEPGGGEQRADGPDRVAIDSPVRNTRPGEATEQATPREPLLGSLNLEVVYAKGRVPAPHVRVILGRRGMAWDEQDTYRTGSDGRVLIEGLEAGTVVVRALRGGENRFTIFAGQTKRGVVAIPTGVRVEVEVVDGDGAPVEKAGIWLSERWRDNRGGIAGETDYRGKVQLDHVSPHCSLAVRCPGFEPSRLYRIRAAIGAAVRLRIALRRGGGVIEGVVVDGSGEPVSKAFVLVGPERPEYAHRTTDGSWAPGAPPISRMTDKRGRFTANTTPEGKLRVQVRHPEFAPWTGDAEARAGVPVSLRVVLSPGAVLFGKVSDSRGNPVPHARLSVGEPSSFAGRTEFADKAGAYEIRGLASGEQKTLAVKGAAEAEAKIRIAIGERVEWNPVLDEKSSSAGKKLLVGRVVDHRDRPLRRWRVAARPFAQAGETVSTNTDGKGRFRLAVEWAELRVWTHPPGEHSGFPALIRDGVRFDEGELILRVEDPLLRVGEIRGVVVDSAGHPVRAQIQAWHTEVSLWREYETDAKTGEFLVRNVPPGKIDLKVTASDHPWKKLPQQTIAVGQTIDLGQIVMESGGRIEGTMRLVGGRAPKKVKISIYHDKGGEAGIATYADGRYRSGVLAAGRYVVFAMGERFASLHAKTNVTAGSTTTLNFRLQPAALRTLQFAIPQGVRRPRFLNVHVRSKKGRLVSHFGMDASRDLRGDVSLLPGEYVLHVWGPGTVSWLKTTLRVESLADTEPVTFTIQPQR